MYAKVQILSMSSSTRIPPPKIATKKNKKVTLYSYHKTISNFIILEKNTSLITIP
jgi:hypothetical protein